MCKFIDFKTLTLSKESKLMHAALIWAKSGVLGFPEFQHQGASHLGTSYLGGWQMLLPERVMLLHLNDGLLSVNSFPSSSSSPERWKEKWNPGAKSYSKGNWTWTTLETPELGAEVALGWGLEAPVEALVLVQRREPVTWWQPQGSDVENRVLWNGLVGLLLVWAGSLWRFAPTDTRSEGGSLASFSYTLLLTVEGSKRTIYDLEVCPKSCHSVTWGTSQTSRSYATRKQSFHNL